MEQSSVTLAVNSEPLPPDVEAARKQRINLDLLSALKHPCSPNTAASIQGIGLYTHVAPSSQTAEHQHGQHANKAPDPVFLPIGGQQRLAREKNVVQPRISNEVVDLYRKLQDEMNVEEKHFEQGGMSMDKLKERYGGLGTPEEEDTAPIVPQKQLAFQQILQSLQKAAAAHNSRRVSLEGGVTGDIVMGGTEQEQSEPAAVTRSGNTYEAARDPRLRGR